MIPFSFYFHFFLLLTFPNNFLQYDFRVNYYLMIYYQNKISTVPMDMAAALAMSEPLISILDDADMEEID